MVKIDEIMDREVTRRQFLTMLGAGVLGLLGISTLLGILSGNAPEKDGPAGYGLRHYGP